MRPFILLCIALAVAPAAAAQDGTGGFIIRLGHDTIAVERYTRAGGRIEGELLTRSPRTTVRTYRADLATYADTAPVPMFGGLSSSWAGVELAVARFRALGVDSAAIRTMAVTGNTPGTLHLRRRGGDALWMTDGNGEYVLRVDPQGQVMSATLVGMPLPTAERVVSVDLAALSAAFTARDERGEGLGVLSPPDSVLADVRGARIRVDYSRPAKRGRPLFGSSIVPWNRVWRTGANNAPTFTTDRPLQIGPVRLAAGAYSLFTIPAPDGWMLVINSQTGQAGTAHDASRDIGRIPMRMARPPAPVERFTITVAPEGRGGVLRLQWDTVDASVPFTVLNAPGR